MHNTTIRSITRFTVLTAAALCIAVGHAASAQTADSSATPSSSATAPDATGTAANPAPGTSTVPSPTPPPITTQPAAPSPAAPTAPASSAPAPTPSAPTPRLTYSGLLDGYYQWSFNNPKHLPQNALTSNIGVYTPLYNARQNTPTLSLAELNINYAAPTNGGIGAKATLMTGDTADMNHGGLGVDPNNYHEAYFKNIQQLYVTYLAKAGYGVDFGEFYTPFGYEVTESNSNYNYSRSDVFTYLLPIYHAGFRLYTPSMKGLTLTGFIVNALNNTSNEGVHDDNNDKGFIGQVNYTDPKGKFVVIENIGYSRDKNVSFASIAAPDADKTTLSDLDLTLTPNASTTIGGEYVYRKDDAGTVGKLSTNGYAAYYRYQINPADAAAFRYSYVDQKNVGRPWDLTGTYEIKSSGGKFLTRFEYRYDKIYGPFYFADKNGNFNKSTQNTLTVSEVFTF